MTNFEALQLSNLLGRLTCVGMSMQQIHNLVDYRKRLNETVRQYNDTRTEYMRSTGIRTEQEFAVHPEREQIKKELSELDNSDHATRREALLTWPIVEKNCSGWSLNDFETIQHLL